MKLPALARWALPGKLRLLIKERLRARRFRSACRELLALAPHAGLSTALIGRLQRGWENEGFTAGSDLLAVLSRLVPASRGDLLECGSGLSTIVLGALTRGTGRRVYSLEHVEEWAERVRREVELLGFTHVSLIVAPLRGYDGYWWYGIDEERLPRDIEFIVCDGPPGDTPGGRGGLLRRLGGRLPPACLILLDDASRPGEQAVLRDWAEQFGSRHRLEGSRNPVAIVEMPG
jgi:hypothetical protein